MKKLTFAQKREYDFLKKHGSTYVYGKRRRNIFEKLVEKGLAIPDVNWFWFHIKK